MPVIAVELDELRAACVRISLAAGEQPSRGALGEQKEEQPTNEAPTEQTAP